MIQSNNSFVCAIVGHDPHIRRHRLSDRNVERFQVLCERCMKDFGSKDFDMMVLMKGGIKAYKEEIEEWLESILPERNKKRLYKKAKELWG
jgi:hypothetical protein